MPAFGSQRPNVKRMRRKGDLQGLRQAVEHREERVDFDGSVRDTGAEIRAEALESLSDFFGPPAIEGVRHGLQDSHPGVRVAAVRAARAADLQEARDQLLHGVATWSDPPHGQAVKEAFELLIAWEHADTPEVFARTLAHCPDLPLSEDHRLSLLGFAAADARGADASIESLAADLIGLLSDPEADPDARMRAGEIATWIGPQATPGMATALADGKLDALGIRAAGELRDSRMLEPLMSKVRDPDPEVRTAAASALGELLDTAAVVTLVELTQDEAFVVRKAASDALEAFGVSAVVVGLAATVAASRGDETPGLPDWVERALGGAAARSNHEPQPHVEGEDRER